MTAKLKPCPSPWCNSAELPALTETEDALSPIRASREGATLRAMEGGRDD